MDDTYQITEDPDAKEVEVVQVICPKCKHYELHEPSVAKAIFDNWKDFKCELCYAPPGVIKHLNSFTTCGRCNQVMGKERACYCPIKDDFGFRTVSRPKWIKPNRMTTIEREIEDGKNQRLLVNKKHQGIIDEHDRQIKDSKNLQLIADALSKKVTVQPTKEVNHEAIQ